MKIFVSDYDGTLNRGGGVTERDLKALDAWQKAGNLFGIASGRDLRGLVNVWQRCLPLKPDFLIGGNGTQLYRGLEERVLRFSANGKDVPLIVDLILRRGGRIVHITAEEGKYILSMDGKIPENTKDFYFTLDNIPAPKEVYSLNTYFDTNKLAEAFCAECCTCFPAFTAYQNTDCGDIVPRGTGKAEGIAAYIKHTGLKPEMVITAGDSGNDLGMLRAYVGCTLPNADEELKTVLGEENIYPDIAAMLERYL
ncbi:MAG: HAD family phosphatase [Ruminococcaceae bacterium]|nr:HAD family phosphatase [Oscillospiraceae bacterium]